MAKLPDFHAARILAEEFIVEGGRNGAPQRAVVLCRNPRLRHLQQTRGQSHVRQQLVRIQIASAHTLQRGGDEANGDGSRFRGRILHANSLRDTVSRRITYRLN